MIASITGILQENSLTEIVVDVNGVGYALTVPLSTVDEVTVSEVLRDVESLPAISPK